MRENGSRVMKLEMEEEFKFGLMDRDMKDIGEIIELMEKEDLFMLTVIFMKANG